MKTMSARPDLLSDSRTALYETDGRDLSENTKKASETFFDKPATQFRLDT
jgi:hypothetical protein